MPIACTRCGNKQEGEIISPPIAFAFKHGNGCGHGIGPLAVIRGTVKVQEKKVTEKQVDKIIAKKLQPTTQKSKQFDY
tara:strand:- start:35 stop:268 length:234 start_codon:yes stop_codon:yes gene_type:complete